MNLECDGEYSCPRYEQSKEYTGYYDSREYKNLCPFLTKDFSFETKDFGEEYCWIKKTIRDMIVDTKQ